MGFTFDFDSSNTSSGFSIIEEGKYEAIIINAEANEWQGNYSIKFDVEIRSDVPQKHQGGKVLYNTLYLNSNNEQYKEQTEKKRNAFFAACGYSGQLKLNLDQVVKEIVGKNVLVYVKHQEDKEGKKWPKVAFVGNSNASKPAQSNNGPINVSDDVLPF